MTQIDPLKFVLHRLFGRSDYSLIQQIARRFGPPRHPMWP